MTRLSCYIADFGALFFARNTSSSPAVCTPNDTRILLTCSHRIASEYLHVLVVFLLEIVCYIKYRVGPTFDPQASVARGLSSLFFLLLRRDDLSEDAQVEDERRPSLVLERALVMSVSSEFVPMADAKQLQLTSVSVCQDYRATVTFRCF